MDSKDKLDIYKELQKQLEERKNKQKFYQSGFLTIEADVTNDFIYCEWTEEQQKESLLQGISHVPEALSKYKINKVLNDFTKVKNMEGFQEDLTKQEWFQEAVEAGLKKMALVFEPGKCGPLKLDETITETTPGYSLRQFESLDEAKIWLKGEGSTMTGNGNAF